MKKERRMMILLGLLMSISGIALSILSVFLIIDRIDKEHTYIDTTGIVVGYDAQGGYDDDLHDNLFYEDMEYAPIVKYVVGGKAYETKHNVYSSNPEYLIGQKVALKYNPKNPEEVIFKFNNSFWILSLLGVVLTVCGIILTTKGISKKKKDNIYI